MNRFLGLLYSFSGLLSVFAILWLVFAIFDFNDSNEIVHYSKSTHQYDQNKILIVYSAYGYRVQKNHVLGMSKNGEISKYEDCKIYDTENWSCIYDDNSATFGFRKGEYFSANNTEKFPHLKDDFIQQTRIWRLHYIIGTCKQAGNEDEGFLKVLFCAIYPFID